MKYIVLLSILIVAQCKVQENISTKYHVIGEHYCSNNECDRYGLACGPERDTTRAGVKFREARDSNSYSRLFISEPSNSNVVVIDSNAVYSSKEMELRLDSILKLCLNDAAYSSSLNTRVIYYVYSHNEDDE